MASRMHQTTNSSSYRSVLRIESLERRCLLSANMGLVRTTTANAPNQLVVADFDPIWSDATKCVPLASDHATIELPTTEVRMPASNLPEGTIQPLDHPFPPIHVVAEETIRMLEKSGIPDGTIQRLDRPFPPLFVQATPSPPSALPDVSADPFVSTVLPRMPDGTSVQPAWSGDKERVPIVGLRLLPLSPIAPVVTLPMTLPSKELPSAAGPDVSGHGLNFEPRAVLSVGSKTSTSNTVDRQSEQGNMERRIEQLSTPKPTIAARDIAFVELTTRAFKVKPFGRNTGKTL